MTRATLRALAARVEAAEGADYQLDRAITDALDWPNGMGTPPDLYTASLDAAVSLVPEGWGIELSRYWVAADERPRWRAHLTGGLGNLHGYCKEAMSGALALTAAALRAMAEDAPHE